MYHISCLLISASVCTGLDVILVFLLSFSLACVHPILNVFSVSSNMVVKVFTQDFIFTFCIGIKISVFESKWLIQLVTKNVLSLII